MQTPPSIEDRNSTVAKHAHTHTKRKNESLTSIEKLPEKPVCSNKVENELRVLSLETMGSGFRKLKAV